MSHPCTYITIMQKRQKLQKNWCWPNSFNISKFESNLFDLAFWTNIRGAIKKNIARIANAVQCHSWLSGDKDCHEFRFSIVRIVISVSIVISLHCIVTILQTCDNWDTDYNSYDWEPEFMTIFVTWQSRVTLDSIRNSCDVFWRRPLVGAMLYLIFLASKGALVAIVVYDRPKQWVLITPIKCRKGHRSLGSLFQCKSTLSESVTRWCKV